MLWIAGDLQDLIEGRFLYDTQLKDTESHYTTGLISTNEMLPSRNKTNGGAWSIQNVDGSVGGWVK